MTRHFRRRVLTAALCAGLLPSAADAAGAEALFYERALMSAAGARCGLFAPDIAAALSSATQQARGAALRAGVGRAALAATEKRAQAKAWATPCASPDLSTAAVRVRSAFAGYARIDRMDFPGDASGWKAARGVNGQTASAWRLAQTAAGPGPMVFGVAADAGEDRLTAVAAWPGALSASGARLVVRDITKSREPYLDSRRRGLAGRAPPRSASRVFLASGRSTAGANLLPEGAATGAVFRFPSAAVHALRGLDPREALIVEIVYPARNGERVERVAFEVGDFAAAVTFLEVGR
jgi:hypothetical protein